MGESMHCDCVLGFGTARIVVSMMSIWALPVFVALLLSCTALGGKLQKGIQLAVLMVSLLYVAGASNADALLHCQTADHIGQPLGSRSFMKQMPLLPCDSPEATRLRAVGYAASFTYGVLIPLLIYIALKRA